MVLFEKIDLIFKPEFSLVDFAWRVRAQNRSSPHEFCTVCFSTRMQILWYRTRFSLPFASRLHYFGSPQAARQLPGRGREQRQIHHQ